eukprot:COSAG06_NODE_40320_length_403_cov_0.661184_1_plen_65_part_10
MVPLILSTWWAKGLANVSESQQFCTHLCLTLSAKLYWHVDSVLVPGIAPCTATTVTTVAAEGSDF